MKVEQNEMLVTYAQLLKAQASGDTYTDHVLHFRGRG